MPSGKQKVPGCLNLEGARYQEINQDQLNQLTLALADTDFYGVAISAPRRISTELDDQLPVLLGSRLTMLRSWEVRWNLNCFLVAWNPRTQEVHLGHAFPRRRKGFPLDSKKVSRPPKPTGVAAKAFAVDVQKIDARSILNLPWEAVRLCLAAVSFDRASNVVEVELQGEEDPEIEEATRAVFPLPNLNAGLPEKGFLRKKVQQVFPSYLQGSSTPKQSEPGLSFTADTKARGRLAVHGAFVTTARASHIPGTEIKHRFSSGQDRLVGAVVPLTFLLVGLDWEVPRSFQWAVPVYSEKKMEPGAPLCGYFSVDVPGEEAKKLPPGNYAAYMVMEKEIHGSVKFEWKEL